MIFVFNNAAIECHKGFPFYVEKSIFLYAFDKTSFEGLLC